MPSRMIAQIRAELAALAARAPVLSSPIATEKIYELFVLSCLCRALRSIGATLSARDGQGNLTGVLEFRMAPGVIYSPTRDTGFILVELNGKRYEIHHDIRVLGKSKVLHELDVCLLDEAEAVRCRQLQINPAGKRVRFFAECKFYGSRLPLQLGREFLGLGREYSLRVKTLISNTGSPEIHQLITTHRCTENFYVSPASSANVRRFIEWLANELRQVL